MKILAGQKKGHPLSTPKGSQTRPALAKIREAIFSTLGDVAELVILDVFAGSGSLGFEALSRGGRQAYFVDGHKAAIRCLIANAEKLGFGEKTQIFQRQLPNGLKKIHLAERPHIIFCDPPYDQNLLNPTLTALVQDNFVDRNSWLIVEHSPREMPDCKGLEVKKQKKYGQTLISYLQLCDQTQEPNP